MLAKSSWPALYWLFAAILGFVPLVLLSVIASKGGTGWWETLYTSYYQDLVIYILIIVAVAFGDVAEMFRISEKNESSAYAAFVIILTLVIVMLCLAVHLGLAISKSDIKMPVWMFLGCGLLAFICRVSTEWVRTIKQDREIAGQIEALSRSLHSSKGEGQ